MRYAITLRKGGLRQVYDAQYGSIDAAVFGVLRKESARQMTFEPRGGSEFPLEIFARRATADDVARGFAPRRRAKGARLVDA